MNKILVHGSALLKRIDFPSTTKVVKKNLYISSLSMFSQKSDKLDENYIKSITSGVLKNDLLKTSKNSLINCDKLIVDLYYTVHTKLAIIDGCIYTANKLFLDSDFYKTNSNNCKIVSFADINWKEYFDEYIKNIKTSFSSNDIILVRVKALPFYNAHNHIRPWNNASIKQEYKLLNELEEYFIDSVNPTIVDIGSQYVLEKPYGGNPTPIRYCEFFFGNIKNAIATAINGKSVTVADYSFVLDEYIQFYEHLEKKRNNKILFKDNDIVDKMVLCLPLNLIKKHKKALVKLKAQKFCKDDEYLSYVKKDTFFVKLINTVLLCKSNEWFENPKSVSFIFKYNLNAKDSLLKLIKNIIKDAGGDDHAVNEYNLNKYYNELKKLERDKDNISAYNKKIIEFQNKHPLIIVDLWGSCICREIINEDSGIIEVKNYGYRNSCLFAFDEPIDFDLKAFDNLQDFNNSVWRRNNCLAAIEHSFVDTINNSNGEWLMLDFYDLLCQVAKFNGGYFNVDKEIRMLGFYKKIKNDCEFLYSTDFSDDEIKSRMDRFIDFLKSRYGSKIIIVCTDVKSHYIDEKRKILELKNHNVEMMPKLGEFLLKWQNYFIQEANPFVIDYAKYYFADDLCVSGATMVHYEKDFYTNSYKALKKILTENKKQRIYDSVQKKEWSKNYNNILLQNPAIKKSIIESNIKIPD